MIMNFTNKRVGFFSIFFMLLLHVKAQTENPFRIQSSSNEKCFIVDSIFQIDSQINVFDNKSQIYGLSINMSIESFSKDYLVRVVLTDNEGFQYLVAEAFEELYDKNKLTLTDYCEETALLNHIIPSYLKIFIKNARVRLESIKVSTSFSNQVLTSELLSKTMDRVKVMQAQEKVDKINEYNRSHQKLWRAAVTDKCLLPYRTKMRLIGCPDSISTGGIEYYSGGIFEFGKREDTKLTSKTSTNNAASIKSFDWRHVHGKNWITSVKDQGYFPYCTAFASVGTLESGVQLYYNQIIDSLNLSEKDAIVNHVPDSPLFMIANDGSWSWLVLDYIKNHGVCDEESYPFATTIPYTSVQPKMMVSIEDYDSLRSATKEEKKMALVAKGPMVSGYSYHRRGGHAMQLIGFGTVEENMEILYHKNLGSGSFFHDTITIPENDRRIGDTYWVFKNSYGDDNPFINILFENEFYNMDGPFYIKTPIYMIQYDDNGNITNDFSEENIVCEDADGDGYYFWGVGPKPSTCPDYAMYYPDFDDSDPLIGPIHNDGIIENINPEERDTLDSYGMNLAETFHNCYNHLVFQNGEDVEVIYDVYFRNGAKIYLRNGSLLTLLECSLYDVELIMESGSKLVIDEGAKVKLRQGTSFVVPQGAIVEIRNGSIE